MATNAGYIQTGKLGARRQSRLSKALMFALFVFLGIVFFFPLYWMVISSLRPEGRIFVDAMEIIPSALSLDTYRRLFEEEPYGLWFLNSITQTGGFAIMGVFLCTTGGYALAKFRFRYRNLLFILILVSQMIPFHLLIVSLFLMIIQLGMVETYQGAIIPLAASPKAYSSSANTCWQSMTKCSTRRGVDGASEYQIFWHIVLPNAKPAIATLFILFCLEYWNNLLWPLIVFRKPENFPLLSASSGSSTNIGSNTT